MLELPNTTILAGKYAVVRALASGGMGTICVARHLQLGIDVAVKQMIPAYVGVPDARARFEREARAAAGLSSPHLVRVHDYGVHDGLPFLVMELLRGEDLAARIRTHGRLDAATLAPILTQICKAIHVAHQAGIVHRDIKPANVFLARQDDGDEIVKVLDFGIAKLLAGSAEGGTQSGALLGSPHYMSPEQARGSTDVDGRTDLWSVGVIAFQALTGRLPFRGKEIGDVIFRVCADPIPAPSSIHPPLGPAVDAFFARALARDRTMRFQSAMEMARAFEALEGRAGLPALPLQPGGTRTEVLDDARPPATVACPPGSTVQSTRALERTDILGAPSTERWRAAEPADRAPRAPAQGSPSTAAHLSAIPTARTISEPPPGRSPWLRRMSTGFLLLAAGYGLSQTPRLWERPAPQSAATSRVLDSAAPAVSVAAPPPPASALTSAPSTPPLPQEGPGGRTGHAPPAGPPSASSGKQASRPPLPPAGAPAHAPGRGSPTPSRTTPPLPEPTPASGPPAAPAGDRLAPSPNQGLPGDRK
jgi:serine/threonine protein kinase